MLSGQFIVLDELSIDLPEMRPEQVSPTIAVRGADMVSLCLERVSRRWRRALQVQGRAVEFLLECLRWTNEVVTSWDELLLYVRS